MALILCPRDRHLLVQEDPTRQPCRQCGGVFVRREAIEPLVEELQQTKGGGIMMVSPYREAPGMGRGRATPRPPEEAELRYLACPFCSKQMNRLLLFEEFRIVVDMCINHGVWFDGQELDRATAYIRATRPLPLLDDQPEELEPEQSVEILLSYFFSRSQG